MSLRTSRSPIPGSINSYDLRSQDPAGPFGKPLLTLLSGHFPTTANQVAITSSIATAFNLRVGDNWKQDGVTRKVVGTVENPQSLLDEFALVIPGQVPSPSGVTVLFDANGASPQVAG